MRISTTGKTLESATDWMADPNVLARLAPLPGEAAPIGACVLNIETLKKSGLSLDRMLDQIETAVLCEAMQKTQGNQTEAAELLGLHRTTLVMRLRALRSKGINAAAYKIKAQMAKA